MANGLVTGNKCLLLTDQRDGHILHLHHSFEFSQILTIVSLPPSMYVCTVNEFVVLKQIPLKTVTKGNSQDDEAYPTPHPEQNNRYL